MPLFTSTREIRLWGLAGLVLIAVISTLFLSRPLLKILSNQNTQAVLFMSGLILVGITIVLHGSQRPGKMEVVVWSGFISIFLMLFLRLGLSERSHLIEYSVLAIFIHNALKERKSQGRKIPYPAIIAFALTGLIGVVDEAIQIVIPERVFDPADILFNGFAAFMAIGFGQGIIWVQKHMRGRKKNSL